MGQKDPRIDTYIANAAEFAQPVLMRLREIVHAACPAVEETIKWGTPHFTYQGMLCHMAAFKQHCSFGFWKGAMIVEQAGDHADAGMGQFGRITRLSDLPTKKILTGYIKKAMALNEAGVKAPAKPRPRVAKKVVVPPDLLAALKTNATAWDTFETFSPSHQREYVEWITEAKRPETRQRRLETTLEWLAEGKPRNWKYLDCR